MTGDELVAQLQKVHSEIGGSNFQFWAEKQKLLKMSGQLLLEVAQHVARNKTIPSASSQPRNEHGQFTKAPR